MTDTLLNRQQTEELFAQEGILIGRENVIPIYRAVDLFGRECAEWIESCIKLDGFFRPAIHHNSWWVGNQPIDYLTYAGFQLVVSWHNCRILTQRQTEGKTVWEEVWSARVAKLDAQDAAERAKKRNKKSPPMDQIGRHKATHEPSNKPEESTSL